MSSIIFNNNSSSPDAAGSGKAQIYSKSDGKVYAQVGSSAETPIQTGTEAAAGKILQVVSTSTSTVYTTTSQIPNDNSVPQSSEGAAMTNLDTTITPIKSTSKLKIEVDLPNASNDSSGGYGASAALFRDSATSAIMCTRGEDGNNGAAYNLGFVYMDDANSTSATTYKIRFGRTNGGTARMNTNTSNAILSHMIITEIDNS